MVIKNAKIKVFWQIYHNKSWLIPTDSLWLLFDKRQSCMLSLLVFLRAVDFLWWFNLIYLYSFFLILQASNDHLIAFAFVQSFYRFCIGLTHIPPMVAGNQPIKVTCKIKQMIPAKGCSMAKKVSQGIHKAVISHITPLF